MSIVVGVDQSMTCTACVALVDGELKDHDVIRTSKKQGNKFDRMFQIAQLIRGFVLKSNADEVVVEGLSFGSAFSATRDLAGLQAVIVTAFYDTYTLEENLHLVAPTSVKKKATGGGKADKEDMLAACPPDVQELFLTYGKTTGRYDLADAYHIATMRG